MVRHFWAQASLSSRTSECSFAYLYPKYLAQGLSVKEGRPPVSDMSQPVLVELREREACDAQDFGLLGEAKPQDPHIALRKFMGAMAVWGTPS